MASALAMDKVKAKQVFVATGVPTPEFCVWRPGLIPPFDPPWVVKPARQGSTIGVRVVSGPEELEGAAAHALRYDDVAMVERFIEGRELTVAVLEGRALEPVEVIPRGGFYDYRAKYTPGETEYRVPAEVEEGIRSEARRLGVAAYEALGCRGCARVDMRLDREGRLWVLEVNTIPGMTPTSLVPKAAAYEGLTFDDLVLEILKGASLKVAV